jgi:ribonuclease HI
MPHRDVRKPTAGWNRDADTPRVLAKQRLAMKIAAPHFLLLSQARAQEAASGGRWQFVLESVDGSLRLEAADEEESASTQRLELLAAVRGLEALDQPSRVTLVTGSRYVSRGIRFGLPVWRENGWQWERFGEMAPIRDADLWRRVDIALTFHHVECRNPRLDESDDLSQPSLRVLSPAAPKLASAPEESPSRGQVPIVCRQRGHRGKSLRFDAPQPAAAARDRPLGGWARMSQWLANLWRRFSGSIP